MVACESRTPREYFNRPIVTECITLIQDGATLGMMACDGEILPISSKLTIIKTQEEIEKIREYYNDREYGHYICLKYPKKCKRTKKRMLE